MTRAGTFSCATTTTTRRPPASTSRPWRRRPRPISTSAGATSPQTSSATRSPRRRIWTTFLCSGFSHLSEETVEQKLADGQLTQSQVAGYLDFQTDHSTTCTKLSKLSFFGTLIKVTEEYVEDPNFTYLLLFSKGTTPGWARGR